jgi:RsiW-degrading membrane proteinase PrsW (M82 family)
VAEPCRICDDPAVRRLGSYAFCERHYAHATRARPGVLRADLISVALLVAFVILVFVLDAVLQPRLEGTGLLAVGIILALVPTVIWLAYFYRRDRLEPEPKTMVVGVCVLGGLLGAVGIPVVDYLYGPWGWLTTSSLILLAGAILVLGFSQEFLKYAAVRFSVYGSREFDEPTDGILYATAAGLGLATILNVAFVVESGGVDLGVGTIRIVVTALAQASFAGITGYFLGRDKLESRPIWWMPVGLSIAAALNGLFFFLRGTVAGGSIAAPTLADLAPWLGLALAAGLTLAVAFVLTRLIRNELRALSAATDH